MKTKTALITGGTKGIGKAIATMLAEKNVRLVLNYFSDEDEANKTKSQLKARLIQADVSTYEGANKILDSIDTLDYIVFNVGITDRTAFGQINIEAWEKVLRTNLTIPFFILQHLKEKIAINGRVIFITSISGIVPDSVSISYGVSKAGENMLVKYLAKEFASKRITVNAIAPGYVQTDWHKNKSSAQIKRISEKSVMKRFATTQEIANVVKMLIENEYVTGQIIRVDGGFGLA